MQTKLLIITLLAVCVLSGCGGPARPAGLPTLYSCEITITQGGQPFEGALVRLLPDSGTFEWVISGNTDSSGIAKLVTHAKYPGAPEGTFKVLVSKTQLTPSKYPQPDDSAPQSEWEQWKEQAGSEKRQKVRYVKPEYDNVKTTPHSITITKGKNQQTFDVGEAIKEVLK